MVGTGPGLIKISVPEEKIAISGSGPVFFDASRSRFPGPRMRDPGDPVPEADLVRIYYVKSEIIVDLSFFLGYPRDQIFLGEPVSTSKSRQRWVRALAAFRIFVQN